MKNLFRYQHFFFQAILSRLHSGLLSQLEYKEYFCYFPFGPRDLVEPVKEEPKS